MDTQFWEGFGNYNGRLLQVTHVNENKPTEQEQARWLIEKIGKNIPAGTAGLERKKKHSDTEEAEQSGRAVNWKGRTKQRDSVEDLFLSQLKLNFLDDMFLFFKLNIHFAHFAFCSYWIMPVSN